MLGLSSNMPELIHFAAYISLDPSFPEPSLEIMNMLWDINDNPSAPHPHPDVMNIALKGGSNWNNTYF